ncbi:hypothetical protein [Falsirhodobacter sp. alg1]|uniref:hypothetical protein n=1 Tax=Falsirhodobacter sp. alg1 TaxID=1472418 RepID=UPI00128ED99F|nr:hypothetical protein [Falsirhodobacter sp. alg1]
MGDAISIAKLHVTAGAALWSDGSLGGMSRNINSFLTFLSQHSTASAALVAWCSTRFPDDAPVLRVTVLEDRAVMPQEAAPRLGNAADAMRFRRVQILWGDMPVSQAVNWYLPNRLPAGVAADLQTSTLPFGVLIAGYCPSRHNTGTEIVDHPDYALTVRAVLSLPDAGDVSLVEEHYYRSLLL